jgi:2-polyprenyl-3-methyl-5-hydroxy-6-metoxy-1,4-benzoquinol methylase
MSATCPNCGALGEIAYAKLVDRLFGAEGEWSLSRCGSERCGLYWVAPSLSAEELRKAYATYYTHKSSSPPATSARRVYHQLTAGYLRAKFGYCDSPKLGNYSTLWPLLYLLPLRREREARNIMWLKQKARGRLLDVGCGSGDWMERMRELGWEVEGLDFDASAVEVARNKGCVVKLGSLEEIGYPSECFDAIVLNHVIEHVPNPLDTVKECRRILRKGGKLLIATPNTNSLGHRIFKTDWRGLEPPRHLHIFNPQAMGEMLRRAGFSRIFIRSYVARSVLDESLQLAAKSKGEMKRAQPGRALSLGVGLLSLFELAARPFGAEIGECLFAECSSE